MKIRWEEYVPRVYRFALRLTGDRHRAEDLTQETFLRAWRRQRQLRDPNAARVWLFRIAANLWKDELWRGKTGGTTVSLVLDEAESQIDCPDELVSRSEELRIAMNALEQLPQRQKEVLHLRAIEDMSPRETSEVLGISENAVKAHLSLARKKMREQLRFLFVDRCPSDR